MGDITRIERNLPKSGGMSPFHIFTNFLPFPSWPESLVGFFLLDESFFFLGIVENFEKWFKRNICCFSKMADSGLCGSACHAIPKWIFFFFFFSPNISCQLYVQIMTEKSKKESYVLKSIFHKLKLPQNTVKWRNLKIGAFCTYSKGTPNVQNAQFKDRRILYVRCTFAVRLP